MIAYMQTNTTQKALVAGLKKAQQTTEKEPREYRGERKHQQHPHNARTQSDLIISDIYI